MFENIRLCRGDISEFFIANDSIAIDTETMGLNTSRDRLCVVQLCDSAGNTEVVQILPHHTPSRLIALLQNAATQKIFHYGRFDLAILATNLGVRVENVYCTKIASRLARTYTNRHGLRDLCREMLAIDLNKAEQSSDWGRENLTDTQVTYAAQDVIYLHKLKESLDVILLREKRMELAKACFHFLPTRVSLDLSGFEDTEIFNHS
ncbi:MAG: ribonuclease D [Alphaproteobacteria bacterium]|nr:MAG: ribonuclease D [Alphaproteobacteria bacterium]